MEYLMHNPHEPIMYSSKNIHKNEESPYQCYFKAGDTEIRKTKEDSNFIHTFCDEYHSRDISDRNSVTSTVNHLNGTIIGWCSKKQSETSRINSDAETRAIYTGVLYQNWIRDFFRSIGYPIEPSSNSMSITKQQFKE